MSASVPGIGVGAGRLEVGHRRAPRHRPATAFSPFAAGFVIFFAVLSGCALRPPSGSSPERDGPGLHPPADLAQVPDAEPKLEPIRLGGPNKPYDVFGQGYVPLTQDLPFQERGLASWYGRKFHGRPTSSGELYDMYAMTAAHPTLPIPSYARIRNPANGREVLVRINDRGPFHLGRIVDLSYTAALKLDVLGGTRPVEIERITFDDILTGAWRRRPDAAPGPAPALPLVTAQASAPMGDRVADTVRLPVEAPYDDPPPATVVATVRGTYWVQLGAFRQHDGAVGFRRQVESQVDWLAPLLTVFGDAALYKLQAGPYASREDAGDAVARIKTAMQLVPVIVERR